MTLHIGKKLRLKKTGQIGEIAKQQRIAGGKWMIVLPNDWGRYYSDEEIRDQWEEVKEEN